MKNNNEKEYERSTSGGLTSPTTMVRTGVQGEWRFYEFCVKVPLS